MTIKGVDVSKYQGDINFDTLADKVNFIIIRGAAVIEILPMVKKRRRHNVEL